MGNVVVPPEQPSAVVASVPRTRRERVVIETRAEVLTRSILILQAHLLRIVLGVVRHRVATPDGSERSARTMGNGQECDARQTPACEGAEARLCISIWHGVGQR